MTKTTKIVMNEDEDFNNGDGKTTKLWISPALELMHAINGWPVMPTYNHMLHDMDKQIKIFNAAIAKAKEESIPVPRVEFVNAITGRNNKLREAIEYIEKHYAPDTFIEAPVSITVKHDQNHCPLGCPIDCWASMNYGPCKAIITVQVARLKPVNDTMTDAEMHDAIDALKDPKGRQDQGAGAGQCGSDAADGVRYT